MSLNFDMFLFIFQSNIEGFCITEPKCMFELEQQQQRRQKGKKKCTFVNFCKFRCVDVDSFVRICLRSSFLPDTAAICTKTFYVYILRPLPNICAEGQ